MYCRRAYEGTDCEDPGRDIQGKRSKMVGEMVTFRMKASRRLGVLTPVAIVRLSESLYYLTLGDSRC